MTDSRILPQWHLAETSGDASLVHAARNGDRNAFGRLYSRYSRMVHGILLARVQSTEVDDLVQDVFLIALPRLRALRDATRFGGWLAAITRNRAIDYHRQSQAAAAARQTLSEPEVDAPATDGPEHFRAETILELIRRLPNAYRETLVLRLVEGMNGPEIAARTGLTPGSVRVNLHRGMRHLREKLEEKSRAATSKPPLHSGARGSLIARWKQAIRKRSAP